MSQTRGKVRGKSLEEQRRSDQLIERARSMRKEPTEAEARLWLILRSRALKGYTFRRQVPTGDYIADFVCFEKRLIVEADGSQHSESGYDERRDAWLRSQGFRVLRLWNNNILLDQDGVAAAILLALEGS